MGTMPPSTVATRHGWLLKFKLILIKYNEKFSSSFLRTTFQVLNRYMWLVATIMERQETLSPSQKVLLDGTGLVGQVDTLHIFLHLALIEPFEVNVVSLILERR